MTLPDRNIQLLVDQCLEAATQLRTSDIHIEPQTDKLCIRMRIDGRLRLWQDLPLETHAPILARLKVMASLDISERRLPQDGRFSVPVENGVRDYRLATSPMMFGEKAVIRVLHEDLSTLTIQNVGYSMGNLNSYQELLSKPHGLILHCGPTGSGKTTALYAAINHLRTGFRNIQTIEDPVEGRLPGVNQAQVNADIGLSFAAILRSFLRQDCDVILVGEIRDAETAELAVQAALTGHLVLGTLHTNSAAGAIFRLVEMGVKPFFLASALMGAVSQRLVRKLCPTCRKAFRPTEEVQRQCHLRPNHQLYQAVGCSRCDNLGFVGRTPLQEVLTVTPSLREAIRAGASEIDIQNQSLRDGAANILMDGVAKAVGGFTTLDEVYKTVMTDS